MKYERKVNYWFRPLCKNVLIFLAIAQFTMACSRDNKNPKFYESVDNDKNAIVAVHEEYVAAWLDGNQNRLMTLFEENARIQPNSMTPIEGKENLRVFWFPDDGSTTVINSFETEILSVEILDTLAITIHTSFLDWTYQKDTINFGSEQKGINTTVYRKQKDESWKIWRSMWTDIYAKSK